MSLTRRNKRILGGGLAIVVAVGVVVLVVKFRDIQRVADQTAADIEGALDALDPLTRASVLAKLSKDAARDVTAHVS